MGFLRMLPDLGHLKSTFKGFQGCLQIWDTLKRIFMGHFKDASRFGTLKKGHSWSTLRMLPDLGHLKKDFQEIATMLQDLGYLKKEIHGIFKDAARFRTLT